MADMVYPTKVKKEPQSPMAIISNKSDPIVVLDSDSEPEVEPQGTVAETPQADSPTTEIEIANSQVETDGSVSGKESEK